ncbi:MAG: HDIG domain-containing protein [Calditrichaeota bacterium]|nr:HDIG domain-containing protein [Calditrichota bacterium]RQW03296.1 MAG: HDIG domain-containing protein [Calditrichota bacterium]
MKKFKEAIEKIELFFSGKRIFGRELSDVAAKTAMALVLIVMIVSIMPSERPFEYSNLNVGSIAREEIIAPFTFPIIKTEKVLETERQEARESISPVFRFNEETVKIQTIKLKNLLNELTAFFQEISKTRPVDGKEKVPVPEVSKVDSLINELVVKYDIQLNEQDISFLFGLFKQNKFDQFSTNLIDLFEDVYSIGLLDTDKKAVSKEQISILRNGLEEEVSIDQVGDRREAINLFREKAKTLLKNDRDQYQLAEDLGYAFLVPNLILDREMTRARQEKAIKGVPTTSGFVHENQRIIDSHEIVTEDVYQKLQSLAVALAEKTETRSGWYRLLFYIGKYFFAIVMVLIIGAYLYYYRLKLYNQNKMLLLITTIFLLQFLSVVLMQDILGWDYLSIPITLGPMLLSMLLDASVAFMGTVIMSLVFGAISGNNFHLTLMAFVVGTIALFSVQKIRNRGQMFKAILYILIGYAVVNFSYGFIHYEPFRKMLQNFAYFELPNSVLVPTAVFLLIGIFEKFFDVTTDITLLELSDLNHPLLKRLSVEAPGTFHHSIIVGNLAEAAAKEIGANSLLARVGCYYHDIGKMQLSEYFVENQSGAVSKHESLTPSMSSLILTKHVRAGLEMAEEYNLPLAVKKFIPEHHGTSIMSYFYHKAQESMDPKDLNENDFRYPGPRPQSKETAIAMLSDAVEAASRTLANPNLQRLSILVENLIEKRFQEGELDECDITLRELNKIKSAFVRVLMGIHHLRIEYPSEEKNQEKQVKTKEPAGESIPAESDVQENKSQKQAGKSANEDGKQPVPVNHAKNNGGKKKNSS